MIGVQYTVTNSFTLHVQTRKVMLNVLRSLTLSIPISFSITLTLTLNLALIHSLSVSSSLSATEYSLNILKNPREKKHNLNQTYLKMHDFWNDIWQTL